MKKIAPILPISEVMPRLIPSLQCISVPEGYGPDTYAPADGKKINAEVDSLNVTANWPKVHFIHPQA